MAYETLIVEVENHVGLIRLNRPDALNALNSKLLGELAEAGTELWKQAGATDQRGLARPAVAATACDIGAVERQPGDP